MLTSVARHDVIELRNAQFVKFQLDARIEVLKRHSNELCLELPVSTKALWKRLPAPVLERLTLEESSVKICNKSFQPETSKYPVFH